MPAATATAHIWKDDQGRAWIDDSNVKVLEVVLDHLAYGWSPEEMHLQHPHLSLAQIYASLAHYYDHRAEFDHDIDASLIRSVAFAKQSEDSPIRVRLRRAGKL